MDDMDFMDDMDSPSPGRLLLLQGFGGRVVT